MNATQNPQVQQLLSQLKDIAGLDAISWWPLAPGWWVALAVLALLFAAMGLWAFRRRAYRHSWQYATEQTLVFLGDQLDEINARETLMKLSELLRRIAIWRFSRAQCAGLNGSQWVEWLTRNDPAGFDWSAYADLLTDMAYAPPDSAPPAKRVQPLIDATRKWIR